MEVLSLVGLLEAILIENPPQISRELPAVLQVLMPLLHSPLASPHIKQVFLDIGLCLMPRHLHHLGTCKLCVFEKQRLWFVFNILVLFFFFQLSLLGM